MKKKESILKAALSLFSDEEYAAVPTLKIAQLAGVSDALIFKHFKNKNTLFQALIQESESIILSQIISLNIQKEPKVFIKELIEFPFNVSEEKFEYWQFYMKQKWNKKIITISIWSQLEDQIISSLKSLQFQDAEKEASLLILILDNIIEGILLNGKPNMLQYKYFLIHKYTL